MTARNRRGLSGDEIRARTSALAAAWPAGTFARLCEAPARWRGRGDALVGREGVVVGVTPGQVQVRFADDERHNHPPELLAPADGTRGLALAGLLSAYAPAPTLPAQLAAALAERDATRAALAALRAERARDDVATWVAWLALTALVVGVGSSALNGARMVLGDRDTGHYPVDSDDARRCLAVLATAPDAVRPALAAVYAGWDVPALAAPGWRRAAWTRGGP